VSSRTVNFLVRALELALDRERRTNEAQIERLQSLHQEFMRDITIKAAEARAAAGVTPLEEVRQIVDTVNEADWTRGAEQFVEVEADKILFEYGLDRSDRVWAEVVYWLSNSKLSSGPAKPKLEVVRNKSVRRVCRFPARFVVDRQYVDSEGRMDDDYEAADLLIGEPARDHRADNYRFYVDRWEIVNWWENVNHRDDLEKQLEGMWFAVSWGVDAPRREEEERVKQEWGLEGSNPLAFGSGRPASVDEKLRWSEWGRQINMWEGARDEEWRREESALIEEIQRCGGSAEASRHGPGRHGWPMFKQRHPSLSQLAV